ncbi:MAG: winged helix-turn-helix transcriptional regulator [Candidatus Thermoplasmatota archaeon]|jgi:DNA-binding transcriptional ArsR family regulator|nr:winged helix-turn-helix transcriptional regulator [Candidatus Thermoplasmatota archaeon]
MNNNILELKKRREIYDYISKNSGLHMRDISRKMNIPFTTLKYHLHYLEKKGYIISKDDGKYLRYYISLEIGEREKRVLNCLRKKTTLHIILWFFIAQQCSQKDLSRYLEKHPATISFHLRNMLNAGIIKQISIESGIIYKETLPNVIERTQISSEKIYILQDSWMIYDLLIKHKENLYDKEIVNGIIEYIEMHISDGIPKKIQNREDTIESVIETFFELFFPPSFCT